MSTPATAPMVFAAYRRPVCATPVRVEPVQRATAGKVAPMRTVGGNRQATHTTARSSTPPRPYPTAARYTVWAAGSAASRMSPMTAIDSSRPA